MKNNDINGHYSRIENSTKVKGDIVSEGDFRIDGILEGSIKTKGKVVVGKDGSIKGAVSCSSADVEGKINGNLFVSQTLNLRSTSIIDGDVVIGKLIVESGASFNASCSMNKEGKKADFKVVKKLDENHEKTA
ncbi:polymer-forming cytoskeletal protein [Flavobacteriaceae bacterium]|nr:polymer-forming cytoskeletal protein [Flavobacteriaceae bacterium]